jgi:hypothetical protein
VTVGDLLGQPVLVEDDERNDDVPAVRDALMAPRRLSRVLFERSSGTRPVDAASAVTLVERGWVDYQGGRLGRVMAALPSLIQLAQSLEDAAVDESGTVRRHCLASSSSLTDIALHRASTNRSTSRRTVTQAMSGTATAPANGSALSTSAARSVTARISFSLRPAAR